MEQCGTQNKYADIINHKLINNFAKLLNHQTHRNHTNKTPTTYNIENMLKVIYFRQQLHNMHWKVIII